MREQHDCPTTGIGAFCQVQVVLPCGFPSDAGRDAPDAGGQDALCQTLCTPFLRGEVESWYCTVRRDDGGAAAYLTCGRACGV